MIWGRRAIATLALLLAGCGGDKPAAGGGAAKPAAAVAPAVDAAPASLWRKVAQPAGSKDLNGVWGTGAELFVVGSGGTILHSGDRGETWTAQSSGTDASLNGVWGSDAEHVWVAGTGERAAVLLHTDDGGTSWSAVNLGIRPVDVPLVYLDDVWGSGEKVVHVVGRSDIADSGNLLQTFDRGRKWKLTGSGNPPLWFNGVWGEGGELFVVGSNGLAPDRGFLLHSTDGGRTFAKSPVEFNDLNAVWGDGAGTIYVVGCNASVAVSSDGGQTWTWPGLQAEHTGVCFSDAWTGRGGAYVVGSSGTILHKPAGGPDWVAEPTASKQGLRALWGGDGDGGSWAIAVGEAGTILRSP